jgi:hypothetical protein
MLSWITMVVVWVVVFGVGIRIRELRAVKSAAKRRVMQELIDQRFPCSPQLAGRRLPSVFYPPSGGHSCPLVLEEVRVFDTPDPAGELVAVVCPGCQQDYALTHARGVMHVRELQRRAERARERRLMEKSRREMAEMAEMARARREQLRQEADREFARLDLDAAVRAVVEPEGETIVAGNGQILRTPAAILRSGITTVPFNEYHSLRSPDAIKANMDYYLEWGEY